MDLGSFSGEIIKGMSNKEYHALPGVSSTGIKLFAKKGPWIYKHTHVTKELEYKETASKRLGKAFHAAMENRDGFEGSYTVIPSKLEDNEHLKKMHDVWGSKKTLAGLIPGTKIELKFPAHKLYMTSFQEAVESEGKEWIHEKELDKIRFMIDSVYENPECMEYIGQGFETELVCKNVDALTGVDIRAMGDLVPPQDMIIDFKTTKCCTAKEFIQEAVYQWSYHYQAEFYLRVFERSQFKFISVRNEFPWEAMVYNVPPRKLDQAKEFNDYYLKSIADCMRTDSWHSLYWGAEIELDEAELEEMHK